MSRSNFFIVPKNTENTKFKEQEQFLENTKMMFSMFSKIVLKNSFQRQEPNTRQNSLVVLIRHFPLPKLLLSTIQKEKKKENCLERSFSPLHHSRSMNNKTYILYE